MNTDGKNFIVTLSFEKAQLPPFNDILVLGTKCPIGREGISKSIEFLVPNGYEVMHVDNPPAESIVINKNILKRIDLTSVLNILESKVFPYMSEEEMIRVDFSVKVAYENIILNT